MTITIRFFKTTATEPLNDNTVVKTLASGDLHHREQSARLIKSIEFSSTSTQNVIEIWPDGGETRVGFKFDPGEFPGGTVEKITDGDIEGRRFKCEQKSADQIGTVHVITPPDEETLRLAREGKLETVDLLEELLLAGKPIIPMKVTVRRP